MLDGIDFPSVGTFIQNVGVPATIAFIVLWKLNQRLVELTQAVNAMAVEVARAGAGARRAAGRAAAKVAETTRQNAMGTVIAVEAHKPTAKPLPKAKAKD